MAQINCLISSVPNGTLPTLAALKAVDVSTVRENSTATVLGFTTPGDGGGGNYYYSAAATSAADGRNIIAPDASTGRWLLANSYSGVATAPITTVTYSGAQETFTVLSGHAAIPSITYYFPPSTSMLGRQMTIKSISTGTVTLQCTGSDKIFDTSEVTSLTSTLVTGQAWNFIPVAGRFYRIDPKEIM